MKRLHLFSFASLFMCAFALLCCSSDDDKVSSDTIKANIVGTWQATHVSGYIFDKNERVVEVDKDIMGEDSERFIFKDDGTCQYLSAYSEITKDWSDKETYKYDINENKIYFHTLIGVLESAYTVISINGNSAIVEHNLDNDPQHPQRITLIKVR